MEYGVFLHTPFYTNRNRHMKKYILVTLLVWGCTAKEDPSRHFTEDQQTLLMGQIVTYMDRLAPGATPSTRFLPQFAAFYQGRTSLFQWDAYEAVSDTSGYYLILRPVGNDPKSRRAVGGYLSFDPETMKIKNFNEAFNSPRLTPEEARSRGRFVWRELSKNRSIDPLVQMRHYIEWPDERLMYDIRTHQWVARP